MCRNHAVPACLAVRTRAINATKSSKPKHVTVQKTRRQHIILGRLLFPRGKKPTFMGGALAYMEACMRISKLKSVTPVMFGCTVKMSLAHVTELEGRT
jgi:hypothetical protein